MKRYLPGLVALLFAAFWIPEKDQWFRQVHWGLVGLAAFTAAEIWRRYSFFAAAAFMVAAWSGLELAEGMPPAAYMRLEDGSVMVDAFRLCGARSALFLWATAVGMLAIPGEMPGRVFQAFAWLGLVNAAVMVASPAHYGLSASASIDSSFIALLWPLVVAEFAGSRWLLRASSLCLPVAAILLAGGSTGVIAAAVANVAWMASEMSWRKVPRYYLVSLLAGMAALLTTAIAAIGTSTFLSSSGRIRQWDTVLGWWWAHADPLAGVGLGTWLPVGAFVQKDLGLRVNMPWAHNDWFQIQFELGFAGLAAVIALFAVALWRSRHVPWLFATVCAYGVVMTTQMPLRFTFSAIYGAVILALVFQVPGLVRLRGRRYSGKFST